jgi:thiol-disulfide isomerase/thioredoxin
MKRNVLLTLGLAVAAALVSLPPAAARRAPDSSAAALQQRRANAPASAPVVREIDLEGLKKVFQREGSNARPLLVNFWATYCEPCREEFPDLVRIDQDYKARGLEFVTVSLDDPAEIKTSVPQFLQKMRAAMPAYLLNVPDPEPAIKWVDAAWGGGLPATYLYDARGQVVFKHTGRVNPQELRGALETVTSDK